MSTARVVDTARSALGTVGVYLPVPFNAAISIGAQREAVGRLERAGYRAAWTNEPLGGKDAIVQLAMLLAETSRMARDRYRQHLGPAAADGARRVGTVSSG